jgi:eukaryotic-like serine/threonine-protein kinase
LHFYCPSCGHRDARAGTCPTDGIELVQTRAGSLLGQQIGNYIVVGLIGTGGMGEVFRAVNPLLGKHVAIKILRASVAKDPKARERLILEAQTVNRIESSGVVKVYDAGALPDGRPYLVMEMLVGEDLADRLHRAPKPPLDFVFPLMDDVLSILDVAHDCGIVHRDLKPANVFSTAERTYVLDFGLAKLLDADNSVGLTSTGAVVGTPHYMAPEQIEARPLDARTDVYAAAVILFEMVAGRRPFEGANDFEILSGHVNKRPPPPRALVPTVSLDLQSIVLTGLAKDPGKRFQTAGAMRKALATVREAGGR